MKGSNGISKVPFFKKIDITKTFKKILLCSPFFQDNHDLVHKEAYSRFVVMVSCIRHITSLKQYTTSCLMIATRQEPVHELISFLFRL